MKLVFYWENIIKTLALLVFGALINIAVAIALSVILPLGLVITIEVIIGILFGGWVVYAEIWKCCEVVIE